MNMSQSEECSAAASRSVTPPDISKHLCKIISANTHGKGVPRRAVLTPCGKIQEKLDLKTQDAQEVKLLSELCEVVRQSNGMPVYPRSTGDLVTMCLSSNNCGAWEALYNDIRTGDVTLATATATLFGGSQSGGGACVLVQCMMAATNDTHLLYIVYCITHLVDHAAPEQTAALATALAARMPGDLISMLGAKLMSIRREMRSVMLTSIARLLAKVDIPLAPLTESLTDILRNNNSIELVALFVYLPVSQFVEINPDIVDLLMSRCAKAAPASRYPALAVLGHMVNKMPDLASTARRQELLMAIVQSTLVAFCKTKPAAPVDARTMFVSAILGGVITGTEGHQGYVPAELFNLVCQALFHCAGSIIAAAK
jgi:hypothetical protein